MDLKERSGNPYRHPWELSRADMVLGLLKPNPRTTRYADIGSGDLYFAERLSRLTDAPVFAVDVNYPTPDASGPIRICTELDQVPSAAIDWAVLMDVLEHVPDDVGLLESIRRTLTQAGRVLVTVPAHAFLWSAHDVFLGHYRRYDRTRLHRVLTRGGLCVVESFYFYAVPFALRALMTGLGRVGIGGPKAGSVATWRYPVDHPLTRAVRATLNGDFTLSRMLGAGRLSGCGLSICAICRRASA